LKTLANIFVWNLKWLKIDLIFINPYELQIIFSFNFFVLNIFYYEISKRAIIHMDFIKHFSKYYDFKKNASIKSANIILILFLNKI
jgi:hypothetical protein